MDRWLEVGFGAEKHAGLVCVMLGQGINLHFGVARDSRHWGYVASWYDGPLVSFGLGPFALICLCGTVADWVWSILGTTDVTPYEAKKP